MSEILSRDALALCLSVYLPAHPGTLATVLAHDAALRAALEEAKAYGEKWRRILIPKHGSCCTCQLCGCHYDECRCSLDETVDKLLAAESALAERNDRIALDNAVCLCGCPASEHESLGEDGEQCEHEDHECVRVAPAVLEIVSRYRVALSRALSRPAPPADAAREADIPGGQMTLSSATYPAGTPNFTSPAPSQQHLDDEGERMAAQAFSTHAMRRCEQP